MYYSSWKTTDVLSNANMVGVYLMCGGVCDEECEIAPIASGQNESCSQGTKICVSYSHEGSYTRLDTPQFVCSMLCNDEAVFM
jgi:hypothetical protein